MFSCSGAGDVWQPHSGHVAVDQLTNEEVLPEWSCSNPFWLCLVAELRSNDNNAEPSGGARG